MNDTSGLEASTESDLRKKLNSCEASLNIEKYKFHCSVEQYEKQSRETIDNLNKELNENLEKQKKEYEQRIEDFRNQIRTKFENLKMKLKDDYNKEMAIENQKIKAFFEKRMSNLDATMATKTRRYKNLYTVLETVMKEKRQKQIALKQKLKVFEEKEHSEITELREKIEKRYAAIGRLKIFMESEEARINSLMDSINKDVIILQDRYNKLLTVCPSNRQTNENKRSEDEVCESSQLLDDIEIDTSNRESDSYAVTSDDD